MCAHPCGATRLDGHGGFGPCFGAGPGIPVVSIHGDVGTEVERNAHPGTRGTRRVDRGRGGGIAPHSQLSRVRQSLPHDKRPGSAPCTMVPPRTAPCFATRPVSRQSCKAGEEEGVRCADAACHPGGRATRDGLPVRLPRVPLLQ